MRKTCSTLIGGLLSLVAALALIPHTRGAAQEKMPSIDNSSAGIVTVFDQSKLAESFARADAKGGSDLFWSHASPQGTYDVQTHTRESVKNACKPEGCSHKGYTAVVYVVSGAATLVVAGSAKSTVPDKFVGHRVQGGESYRVAKGDVYIMPPDTFHWYKNVEAPFRYLEVPVP